MAKKYTNKEWSYLIGIPVFGLLALAIVNAFNETFQITTFLNEMSEGMGALLGSGSALVAAVGAVSLAHYFKVKGEKRDALKKRLDMIIALKAELVSSLYLIISCAVQIEGLQKSVANKIESEIFPCNLTFRPFPEGQITSKYPAFIGSLGSNLSIQIRFLNELLLSLAERYSEPIINIAGLKIASKSIKEIEQKFYSIDEKLVNLAWNIILEESLTKVEDIKRELKWEKSNPMRDRRLKAKVKKTTQTKNKKPKSKKRKKSK